MSYPPPYMGVKHGPRNGKKNTSLWISLSEKSTQSSIYWASHQCRLSIREEITSIMGLHDPLLTTVKKRKRQFCGHTNRAGNLATTILQGSVDGKRGRGRPRTTWLKNIVDWTGLAINDLHTYSMDRQKWKKTIDAVAHGPMAPPRPRRSRDRGGGRLL